MADPATTPPKYPSIPEPQQTLVSLQSVVLRLKEVVELLTGQRGKAEYSLVEGLIQIRKSMGGSSARILELNELEVSEREALAKRTTIIEAEVSDARGVNPTLSARFTEVITAAASATSAVATRTSTLESEVTGARDGYPSVLAKITNVETTAASATSSVATSVSTLVSDLNGSTAVLTQVGQVVDGLSTRWAIIGVLNGGTGSIEFNGIQKADGSGPVFTTTFNSNVIINGNVLINGTVNKLQLTDGAVSTVATGSGVVGQTVAQGFDVPITVKGNNSGFSNVTIIGTVSPGFESPYTGPGTGATVTRSYQLLIDGGGVGFADVYDTVTGYAPGVAPGGSTVYAFALSGTGTTIAKTVNLPAGYHTIRLQSATFGFGMYGNILAFELTK